MTRIVTGLVLIAGLTGTAVLSEPPRERDRGDYRPPLLPRIELLRVLGAGQMQLVTDYFWLQAIQSMGSAGNSFEKERYLDVYYYSDLVTDLDPKFYKVYAFAGNAVPTNLGRETHVNVDEGIHILEKGARQFPNDWQINFYYASQLGYLKKEHAKAAEIFARTAKMPGAPPYVAEIASRLLAVHGDFEQAAELVNIAAAHEMDPDTRGILERRKLELEQERMLQRVDAAIARFREREGRLPQSVQELVKHRDLERIPYDPMMGDIIIKEDGRAYSTASIRLEPMDYERRRKQKYESGDQQQ